MPAGKQFLPKRDEMTDLTLTPGIATVLFTVACLAGYRYRRVWKAEGPRSQLWLSGLVAAGTLLILGFVPLSSG